MLNYFLITVSFTISVQYIFIYFFMYYNKNIPYISFVCAYYVRHLHSSINIWQQNNSNGETEISSYTLSKMYFYGLLGSFVTFVKH